MRSQQLKAAQRPFRHVRQCLLAILCQPKPKPTYEHMVAAEKTKKVAIVAGIREQITIRNTMVKDNTY